MARRHKPAQLKIIQGSKRIPHSPEPLPSGDLDEAPRWFTESQKESWNYAIEHAPPGVLKRIDRGVMAVWVVAEDTHREATQKVAQIGMLIKTPEGAAAQSPCMRIAARQGEIMLRAAALLGFSPASRAGVSDVASSNNPFSDNGRRPT